MQKHEAFEGERGNNRLYLVTCVIYTELGSGMCWVACHPWYHTLLYLPTQIRFLIGEERVRCHCSTLHDALGRTKLHDALGQQQLELSTRTWSVRALLKPRKNLFASRVKQIIFFFTQLWLLNGFKQELKRKLSSFYTIKAPNLLTRVRQCRENVTSTKSSQL